MDNASSYHTPYDVNDMDWEPIILPPDRQTGLRQACSVAGGLKGDAAEFGVYRGGSAHIIADCLPSRELHLFDTFTGLPERQWPGLDQIPPGTFWATSEQHVAKRLKGHRFTLHKGLFPYSAMDFGHLRFALVHIDADYYQSTFDGLWWFGERIVPGGVMLVDDWHIPDCPGVTRAVEEFQRTVAAWTFSEPTPWQALFTKD